jgi:hypothetical protein
MSRQSILESTLEFETNAIAHAIMYQLANEEPPAPALVNREVPASVAPLIEKCLKKERADRPQSMVEVAARCAFGRNRGGHAGIAHCRARGKLLARSTKNVGRCSGGQTVCSVTLGHVRKRMEARLRVRAAYWPGIPLPGKPTQNQWNRRIDSGRPQCGCGTSTLPLRRDKSEKEISYATIWTI